MSTTDIETRLFIDGEFVSSSDGAKFDLYSPFTSELVAQIHEAKTVDVDRAVASGKKAFPAWAATDGAIRRTLMLKLADLVDQNISEFARLEALSMGKPISSYMDQIGTATLRYYAGKALDIHGETSLLSEGQLNFSLKQPYGVTAAIIPWNVPLIMICFKVGPALIAGNTLVLKSSEKAPLTSLLFARLAKEAGFPPGVFNVVSGFGKTCGDALARHKDIRKIAFTGSSGTGKLIQKAAVESNFKDCSLELGGKSPIVIFQDADLEKAAKAAAFSIVANSGQVCMASSRVYVQDSIMDRFKPMYLNAIQAATGKMGDPLSKDTGFGPQADTQQHNSVSAFVEQAKNDGLKVLLDSSSGKDGKGNFVSPMVLYDVPENYNLMQEEIFGAISCINTFKTEEEVISRANDSEFGLYATVFTRDLNRAIRVAKNFEAGSVGVNISSPYYCQDLPLGGFKQSGTGRELGKEGLDMWTEVKSVYVSLE